MDLSGSARNPLAGAREVGPVPESERVELTLLLRRDPSVASLPSPPSRSLAALSGRSYLARETFREQRGARADDLDRVRAFAQRHQLDELSLSLGGRTIRLGGSAGELARIFEVRLRRWRVGTVEYRGRSGPLRLPPDLREVVTGVFGLDDRPQARPHFVRHRTPTPTDVSYTAPEIGAAYTFPSGSDGTGETIGLIELGGGFSPTDLANYFSGLGVPSPSIATVSVDGATNAPTGNPDGPDGEVELDLEIAGSVAPGAQLVVYFAPNTDQGFVDAVTTAVHDATNRPSLVSVSWGSPESEWTGQAMSAISGAAEDAGAMGVTVLAAAGDQGASDGLPGGQLAVDFPASSPYVLGCGGTRLLLSPTRSEVVWNEEAIGEGATGGGVSSIFPRPSYQNNISVPSTAEGFAGRGVPDVAGDADPTSGYRVWVDGSSVVLGGTSAVAPLWAGLLARINQALAKPVGFVNPLLYQPGALETFNDIISGNNDGYSAGPGWDPCTGWGTPNGSRLLAALGSPSGSEQ